VIAGATQRKAVQKKEGKDGKKTVTGKAGARLAFARASIAHAKTVFAFGAGNQYEALKATNFNSYFRMAAMREDSFWEIADSVRALAAQNPEALTAAKADLAHGGNCGEHAQVGFDHLRATAKGQILNMADVEGLDHAFVIMGDIDGESDADLTVCDPWPTQATATSVKRCDTAAPSRSPSGRRPPVVRPPPDRRVRAAVRRRGRTTGGPARSRRSRRRGPGSPVRCHRRWCAP
jgi:hypothetical protein